MMEIQSEWWKLEVMIIPSTSREIHTISHYKSSTSHPHSNENPNWITENDNTICISPVDLPYHIILSSENALKCQSHPSPPISEETQSSVTTLSFSLQISQSNNAYPHSQLFSQSTLPHPWKARRITPQHQYNPIQSSHLSTALILSIQHPPTSQPIPFHSIALTSNIQHPPPSNTSISLKYLTTEKSSTYAQQTQKNNLKEWKAHPT